MEPDFTPVPLSWTDLVGTILPGGYELKELIEADDAEAQFRVRVLGDRDIDAVGQFIQASPVETDRQVTAWELMREQRHPNLTLPLGAGSWDRQGTELGYLILRRADETLDGVLRERALTAPETTEVVHSIAKGLEALHLNGLVHGTLSPEQVLAVGDQIQLSVTGLRRAGTEPEIALVLPKYLAPESHYEDDEEDGENLTPESDIWCLGATIFEALTKKDWSEESREETAALPEPFATIALRCLEERPESRCKLAEAVALLKGEIKPAPRMKAAAATASAGAATMPTPVVTKPPIAENRPATAVTTKPVAAGAATASVASNLAAAPAPAPTGNPTPATGGATVASQPSPAANRSPIPALPSSKANTPAAGAVPATAPQKKTQPSTRLTNGQPRVVRSAAATKSARPPVRPLAASPVNAISRRWIWVGAAVLFVVVLIWALRPSHQTTSKVIPTKAAVPVKQKTPAKAPVADAPPVAAGETKVIRPDGTAAKADGSAAKENTPAPAAVTPPVAASALGTSAHGDVWHVILYTYARREAADQMAATLNKRHPDLGAQVFSREENVGPFLVTAGGGMTKSQAGDARRKAVSEGLPRDSYIQNFPR